MSRRVADAPILPLDPGVRTAIIMPICNEHVPTVFGGLAATIESLQATGFTITNPNAVRSCGCGKSFETSGGGCGSGEATETSGH